MKKFSSSLWENAKNITDFENKKIIALRKEELKLHQDTKVCYICRKIILTILSKTINYQKVTDHCHCTGKHRDVAHSICNSKFDMSNEIPVVFHNCSNYDYHFIIKEYSNEFEKKFECLGENAEKYKISVPIEKKL